MGVCPRIVSVKFDEPVRESAELLERVVLTVIRWRKLLLHAEFFTFFSKGS